MIIDRRKAHFFSVIILVVVLPLIFFIGVILRPEYLSVTNQDIQGIRRQELVTINDKLQVKTTSSQEISSGNIQLQAQTFQENNSLILHLKILSKIHTPDPLIYWQSGSDTPTEITENSILLGSLSTNTENAFTLTEEMKNNQGNLILYSQVFQEIQGVFPITFN